MGRLTEFFSRRKVFEPFGHVVSGRLAEFRLLKLTRAVAKDALVLEGIRIPDPDEDGRREIDMVIATSERLLIVEQKHWSGSFDIQDDGRFLQTRKNGSTLLHKDIIDWTARKGKILVDLHFSRCGSHNLEPEVILVFSNKNLECGEHLVNSPAIGASNLFDNIQDDLSNRNQISLENEPVNAFANVQSTEDMNMNKVVPYEAIWDVDVLNHK